MPGIIPRARALFASGFGYIAFLIASVYGGVRLLPANHPYLNPANTGKFGIHHVIGEAANNLVVKKENIDQLAVFILTLFGAAMLLVQIIMLIYIFMFKQAFAGSLFLTPDPIVSAESTDIAFMLLDQVFGVPDLFCTVGDICTATNATLPWAFHNGLHDLFQFYSLGILLIGIVIFLYYVVVIVAETAITGSPFGQRFQNVWVPIRLVVALGLLVPINYGLNSGQYIVLYAAKFGSGFATNAWLTFNETIKTNGVFGGSAQNPTGERESLLALPKSPSVVPIVQSMSIVHACAYAYWKIEKVWVVNGIVNLPMPPAGPPGTNPYFYIQPYFIKQPLPWMTDQNNSQIVTPDTTLEDALKFYDNGDILIAFGAKDAVKYPSERGNVKPLCGIIRVPVTYLRDVGSGPSVGGAAAMQQYWFDTIKFAWFGDIDLREGARNFVEVAQHREPRNQCTSGWGCGRPHMQACGSGCKMDQQPSIQYRQKLIGDYQAALDTKMIDAWDTYNTSSTDIEITPEILERGWGGAGIWYNKIADLNGAFVTTVQHQPSFQEYPYVMKVAREETQKANAGNKPDTQFSPTVKDGKSITIPMSGNSLEISRILNDFFNWWNKQDPDQSKAGKTVTGGIFNDVMNAIFGTSGLFEMRGANAHIHPLAQLTAVGKALVDSAIINVATGAVTAGLGGLLRVVSPQVGTAADVVSGIAVTTAFVGLTAGLVLYYVLPFLPFLYFFFAVGTWVKSIFEAMVGAPLWALAHLRLDGEGLPGDGASGGYFLIFEIFVRPILTVFGLAAAVLILTAQVRVLNVIWGLVVDNMTGFESSKLYIGQQDLPKGIIDQFFFTIVYTIIVYMMATASFKLIDSIPDNILRFMGAGVSAFSDINSDPTEGLTRYAALGGITIGQQASQGIRSLSGGVGGAIGEELKKAAPSLQGNLK